VTPDEQQLANEPVYAVQSQAWSKYIQGLLAILALAWAGASAYGAGGGGLGGIDLAGGILGGGGCSFASDTLVSTTEGYQRIGLLSTGTQVLAVNPFTHAREMETVLHVWSHSDNDLVNLVITYRASDGAEVRELIRTTGEHPFLTQEAGFVAAGRLQSNMHLLSADGKIGTIVTVQPITGVTVMYNLEVASDHTFVVGTGQWIVHNKCLR
jgi:hypothetical protein